MRGPTECIKMRGSTQCIKIGSSSQCKKIGGQSFKADNVIDPSIAKVR